MQYYKNKDNEFFAYDDDLNISILNKRIENLGLVKTNLNEIKTIDNQKNIDNHTKEKKELFALKKYLVDTDYIARKFTEYLVLGKNTTELLDEYSKTFQMTNRDVLEKSQEARERINQLNKLIDND